MKIGIIAAMQHEFELIIAKIENKKIESIHGINFYSGKINNIDVVGVISGIGKVNAAITTTLLIDNYKPDLIINSGIAGGTLGLNTKDIIVADKLCYSDVDVRAFGYEFGQVPQMPLFFETNEFYRKKLESILEDKKIKYVNTKILTADIFRSTALDIKNDLEYGYAVEMEGAAIAQTCYKLKTPFLSIRFISDILDSKNHLEDYESFELEASHLSSTITLDFINSL